MFWQLLRLWSNHAVYAGNLILSNIHNWIGKDIFKLHHQVTDDLLNGFEYSTELIGTHKTPKAMMAELTERLNWQYCEMGFSFIIKSVVVN